MPTLRPSAPLSLASAAQSGNALPPMTCSNDSERSLRNGNRPTSRSYLPCFAEYRIEPFSLPLTGQHELLLSPLSPDNQCLLHPSGQFAHPQPLRSPHALRNNRSQQPVNRRSVSHGPWLHGLSTGFYQPHAVIVPRVPVEAVQAGRPTQYQCPTHVCCRQFRVETPPRGVDGNLFRSSVCIRYPPPALCVPQRLFLKPSPLHHCLHVPDQRQHRLWLLLWRVEVKPNHVRILPPPALKVGIQPLHVLYSTRHARRHKPASWSDLS